MEGEDPDTRARLIKRAPGEVVPRRFAIMGAFPLARSPENPQQDRTIPQCRLIKQSNTHPVPYLS